MEGGGNNKSLNAECREGFRLFLENAGLKGGMPKIIASGSRESAFDNFKIAVNQTSATMLLLLLVDSESEVEEGATAWQHLKKQDKWDKPKNAGDNDVFLMVQWMEAWLVADRDTLKKFFDAGFNSNNIPQWQDIEAVDKEKILTALKEATKFCSTKRYSKGSISFQLLGKIDPQKVLRASKHAAELLQRLRELQLS